MDGIESMGLQLAHQNRWRATTGGAAGDYDGALDAHDSPT
jgi:hypothetical protein